MMATRGSRRWAELIVMFLLAPVVLAFVMRRYGGGGMVFPAIWALALLCLVMLLRDPAFERRRLWNWSGDREHGGGAKRGIAGIVVTFVLLAPFLAAGLWMYEPERLLALPRQRPGLWAVIMVGYPVLSVYPQEVAFRAFFVHRYAGLMNPAWLLGISAACFGWAHIIMNNWFAVIVSAAGGVLFTLTYRRTRSALAASLEHALWGCYLFTIGWGWYFYGGAVGRGD